jgi:hypothetical protein
MFYRPEETACDTQPGAKINPNLQIGATGYGFFLFPY